MHLDEDAEDASIVANLVPEPKWEPVWSGFDQNATVTGEILISIITTEFDWCFHTLYTKHKEEK